MRILYALVGILVVFLVLGYTVPVIWPLITATSDNISAMTGSDSGTTIIQTMWPVAVLLVGLGLGVAVVIYGVRKFQGKG